MRTYSICCRAQKILQICIIIRQLTSREWKKQIAVRPISTVSTIAPSTSPEGRGRGPAATRYCYEVMSSFSPWKLMSGVLESPWKVLEFYFAAAVGTLWLVWSFWVMVECMSQVAYDKYRIILPGDRGTCVSRCLISINGAVTEALFCGLKMQFFLCYRRTDAVASRLRRCVPSPDSVRMSAGDRIIRFTAGSSLQHRMGSVQCGTSLLRALWLPTGNCLVTYYWII